MSYILDALRRADAERELGEVPTLHTQAAPPISSDDGFDVPPANSWRWLAVSLALLVVGGSVWLVFRPDVVESNSAVVLAAPGATPVAQAPVPSPPLPKIEPVAAPAADKASEVGVTSIASEVQPDLTSEVPQKKATHYAAATAATAATAASAGAAKAAPSSARSRVESKAAAKAVAAVQPDASGSLNDLPEAIRREQPKLNVGGAMHSANPANRMLILNGQVFHEGDQVTADLVLEQIKLKSAVLVYKGYRYSISY